MWGGDGCVVNSCNFVLQAGCDSLMLSSNGYNRFGVGYKKIQELVKE